MRQFPDESSMDQETPRWASALRISPGRGHILPSLRLRERDRRQERPALRLSPKDAAPVPKSTKDLDTAIETCIQRIADESREFPPNYWGERDIQGRLLSFPRNEHSMRIRHRGDKIQLAYAEWPRVVSGSGLRKKRNAGWYDLAIWAPESARDVRGYWECEVGRTDGAARMPLYAVIEIKHREGQVTSPRGWATRDIKKLRHALGTRATRAYYVILIGSDG